MAIIIKMIIDNLGECKLEAKEKKLEDNDKI